MSSEAMNAVRNHSKSRGSARALMQSLAYHTNPHTGCVREDPELLLRETGISSTRQLQRLTRALIAAGELKRLKHGGGRGRMADYATYKITLPGAGDSDAAGPVEAKASAKLPTSSSQTPDVPGRNSRHLRPKLPTSPVETPDISGPCLLYWSSENSRSREGAAFAAAEAALMKAGICGDVIAELAASGLAAQRIEEVCQALKARGKGTGVMVIELRAEARRFQQVEHAQADEQRRAKMKGAVAKLPPAQFEALLRKVWPRVEPRVRDTAIRFWISGRSPDQAAIVNDYPSIVEAIWHELDHQLTFDWLIENGIDQADAEELASEGSLINFQRAVEEMRRQKQPIADPAEWLRTAVKQMA